MRKKGRGGAVQGGSDAERVRSLSGSGRAGELVVVGWDGHVLQTVDDHSYDGKEESSRSSLSPSLSRSFTRLDEK